ncbi:LOW QUALITY PROTEIN: hypothetical protein MAR_022872 [Mya arenaria]|uniref:Uncharacterized protein n=1 Tax=Mya arenaria TaxID=6604 RepID=A0ABY7DMA7_MYAAR|nr:LOW QUALITY PROTEIN: hypothetical protein MAR_022872 [Mya arenaria]
MWNYRRYSTHSTKDRTIGGMKTTGTEITLYSVLGFDGLGKQRNHFDREICQIADNEPSSQAKANMEHGTLNEIDAVSTLLGRSFAITKIHEEFPSRYYLRCVSEIDVLNAQYLLFVSLTETKTKVYKLNRDGDIFKKSMKLALSLYGNDKPKRPTKLSDEQKSLKQEITEASKKVHALGRFVSCKACTVSVAERETHSLSREHFNNLLGDMYQLEISLYELKREKASEAVVFLVADLDRSWESDNIRAGLVAWFSKGYSLTVETMKRIAVFVYTECHSKAIHAPYVSFDGQWHNIVTRTTANKPLAVHQLQKDVWKAVENLNFVQHKGINKHPRWNTEAICDCETTIPRNELVATNFGNRLPKLPKNLPKPVSDNNDETEVTGETITLADVMPDPVQNTCDLNSNVLSMTGVEGNLEIEAYAGNVNKTEWALELRDKQKETNTEDDNHQTENCGTLQLPLSDTTNQTYTENPHNLEALPKLLQMKDFVCILSLLRTTENCNKTGKWDNILADKFGQYFESRQSLASLTRKDREITCINHSWRTATCYDKKNKKSKIYQPVFLSEMATQLNEWPNAYAEWHMTMTDIMIDGMEYEWFYHPKFSTNGLFWGLDGFSNEAWLRVAKSKKTLLTQIMITDAIDPMGGGSDWRKGKYAFALSAIIAFPFYIYTFMNEAVLVSDEININALRLLMVNTESVIDVRHKIWPIQLWEGIIASIDSKWLQYAMTKSNEKRYFWRFPCTAREGKEPSQQRSSACISATRLNKFRRDEILTGSFSYCTSKKVVNEMVDKADKEHENSFNNKSNCGKTKPSNIITKNHHFDTTKLARISGFKTFGTISTERNSLQKVALGVRWERARCNQAKLLPTSTNGN